MPNLHYFLELLLAITAGVIVHLISKWLDSKDK